MRPRQPDCTDDQQHHDEHAEQPGPHLALDQHHRCQRQREHQSADHHRTREHRIATGPDRREEHQGMQTQGQQTRHRYRRKNRVHRGTAVFLPIDVGQMQDQRILVEHQCRADPKKVAATLSSGSRPLTASVTKVSPEIITSTTPNVTWWTCTDPRSTLRGCHHLGGGPSSGRPRMTRTKVRVTKNVRMKATRQHKSGNRPRSTMSCCSQ